MFTLLYCIHVVTYVFVFAWRDGNLPYFPIEISRAAADGGPAASFAFKVGFLFGPPLLLLLGLSPSISLYTFAAYIGLQFITFFDDVQHWRVHMFGVMLMSLGAGAHIVFEKGGHINLLVVAAVVWLLRLALKFLVVVWIEQEPIAQAGAKGMYIMYTGRCKEPQVTLSVFRLCGVLQWIAFGLILCAL
jgi:hypothetical protein